MWTQLMQGTGIALAIFVLTLLFSIPLGLGFCALMRSRSFLLRLPMASLIWVLRGSPLMLQLIFFMYAPGLLLGLQMNRFAVTIIAFSINYAAYFAEIFRGGYLSLDQGQHEAAKALGLNGWQRFWHIVCPQVIRIILPTMAGETMTLVKDTALASVVGVLELFALATRLQSTQVSLVPILIAGLVYLLLNGFLTLFFGKIERRMALKY